MQLAEVPFSPQREGWRPCFVLRRLAVQGPSPTAHPPLTPAALFFSPFVCPTSLALLLCSAASIGALGDINHIDTALWPLIQPRGSTYHSQTTSTSPCYKIHSCSETQACLQVVIPHYCIHLPSNEWLYFGKHGRCRLYLIS